MNYTRQKNLTQIIKLSARDIVRLDALVRLSGLKKQDFMLKRALGQEIVVYPSVKVQKHISDILDGVETDIKNAKANGFELDEIDRELLRVISLMIEDMKGCEL